MKGILRHLKRLEEHLNAHSQLLSSSKRPHAAAMVPLAHSTSEIHDHSALIPKLTRLASDKHCPTHRHADPLPRKRRQLGRLSPSVSTPALGSGSLTTRQPVTRPVTRTPFRMSPRRLLRTVARGLSPHHHRRRVLRQKLHTGLPGLTLSRPGGKDVAKLVGLDMWRPSPFAGCQETPIQSPPTTLADYLPTPIPRQLSAIALPS
jgi:hypothetical protein